MTNINILSIHCEVNSFYTESIWKRKKIVSVLFNYKSQREVFLNTIHQHLFMGGKIADTSAPSVVITPNKETVHSLPIQMIKVKSFNDL